MENNIAAIILESIRPELSRLVEEAVLSALSKARQVRQYPEKVGVEQAAEITGYTKNSLYQMHSRGQIPSAVKVGSKLGVFSMKGYVNGEVACDCTVKCMLGEK